MNTLNKRIILIEEVISFIIESLGMDHINPNELNENTPLVGEGLELDSIDILELVVRIEEKYKIRIETSEDGILIFKNIGSLVSFIEQNAPIS